MPYTPARKSEYWAVWEHRAADPDKRFSHRSGHNPDHRADPACGCRQGSLPCPKACYRLPSRPLQAIVPAQPSPAMKQETAKGTAIYSLPEDACLDLPANENDYQFAKVQPRIAQLNNSGPITAFLCAKDCAVRSDWHAAGH